MRIFKYPLFFTYQQDLELPWGAKILDVQIQNGEFCLWALVDPTPSPHKQTYKIWCLGTGHEAPTEPLTYISTVQKDQFVWHFFRRA